MAEPRSRPWHDRGTLRRPGPHLDRMPVGVDPGGISLAEGLRAAVASGLLVLASLWLQSFPLLLAAFAANLTCFCDAGGPVATRVRALLAFTVLGAAAWIGFGLLRNLPWPVVVPVAALAVFLCSMARVWGAAAQAVGNVLEGGAPALRQPGARALRLLRPLFSLWAGGAAVPRGRIDAALGQIAGCGREAPALAALLGTLGDSCRVMARTASPEPAEAPGDGAPPLAPPARTPRILEPLRENLTWRSAILRHATRATVLTLPALAWSIIWWSPYAHWLTITVALTMQPYFAATWQRVLERVGGTLLGGLIGAAAAFLPATGMVKAVLLVPLCVIGFSVRQVSYGAYIACLTPLVVVLFDVAEPGHSDATIAGMRFGYTVAGGGLALAASLLLWPSWDSRRLRQDVAGTLAAYVALATAIFADLGAPADATHTAARRGAGVASNNLEAALSRALQEPRHIRKREVEAGLVVDAALRRLGGALIALQHEAATLPSDVDLAAWELWIGHALRALAANDRIDRRAPPAAPGSALERIRRAIGVIEAAWGSADLSPMLPRPADAHP